MKAFLLPLVILSALAPVLGRTVMQTPSDQVQGPDSIQRSLARGAYDEAEREAGALVARIEAPGQPGSLETARALDLLVEALVKNGRAARPTTLAAAERAVRLKEQFAGADHLETAASLHNLADVHFERGEFTLALPLHTRGLSIRSREAGANGPAVADSLDHLALTEMRMEDFEAAREALGRAKAIREPRSDTEPLRLARTLELEAWLHRYEGTYANAKAPLSRAMSIRRQLSPGHPDMVSALEISGDLQWLEGEIGGAKAAWAEGLALAERTLVTDHPATATLEHKLAGAAHALGDRAEGRRLLELARRAEQGSLAPCNPEFIGLLQDLAYFQLYDGEYVEARQLYRRALTNHEKCLGVAHSRTATVVHNLSLVAASMGDFAEAERLQQRAINIWSSRLGPDHPYVARGLDALAEVHESRGQHQRARGLYERALAIRRKAAPDHPDVAWTLANLARVNSQSGNVAVAERQISEAVGIYQRVGVSDEPDHFARLLALRGEIDAKQGEYASARASFAEALSTRERIFGVTHPLTAESRSELASSDFALGSSDAALRGALDAERSGREHLRFTVRYLPERQALAYADRRPKGLDLALSILVAGNVTEASDVLDSVIQSRGVILDELAARARTGIVSDPELAALNASLTVARQRFANLMLRSVGEGEAVARKILDEARQQKEEAELALADRSVTVRAELARANIGMTDVRNALPRDSALVSFVRFDRTSFVEGESRQTRPRRAADYVAIVMRAGQAGIAVVPLGPANAVDALVARSRDETTGILRASSPSDAETSYRAAGASLRQRIWDPLHQHLAGASTVFIVPDGSLNLVSFAALPVGRASYLIDRGPVLHYLSAERDLVASQTATTATGGLLAVGGAAFDDASSFARAATKGPAAAPGSSNATGLVASLRSSCGTLQSVHFQPLAGTGREARQVAALWKDSPADVLEGRAASERAFKREAPGHRVIHLATHGFFLDDACSPAAAGTRSVGGLAPAKKSAPKSGLSENPLLLSGLALAGANRRASAGPDDEDGILTSEEVTALNLSGVEWAVLSACDTGLGEVKAGEGVFGLRRAFQMAGVRTVIMSLWSVDDDAARLWMRALYRSRLQRHLNTADAMHAASLSVLHDRRARGASTHPFYWAAFVAAGDWR